MTHDTRQENAEQRHLGERLRKLREERGLSQEALAELMGKNYSRKLIWLYETGGDHMRIGTLFTICKVLDVTLDQLLPERLLMDTDEFMKVFDALTEENRAKVREYGELLLKSQETGTSPEKA